MHGPSDSGRTRGRSRVGSLRALDTGPRAGGPRGVPVCDDVCDAHDERAQAGEPCWPRIAHRVRCADHAASSIHLSSTSFLGPAPLACSRRRRRETSSCPAYPGQNARVKRQPSRIDGLAVTALAAPRGSSPSARQSPAGTPGLRVDGVRRANSPCQTTKRAQHLVGATPASTDLSAARSRQKFASDGLS
jgi:hypothetical protein